MTRNSILNISEMSDSREVLVERPHKFVSIFAYILITFLAVALIWAIVGEIDVYVSATGEVRPNDTISTIRSTVNGRVAETGIEDGMIVSKGDVLFTVDVQDHFDTLEIMERQYSTISNEIENLMLLRESVMLGENLFNPRDASQSDYYFRYQKYVADIDAALEQMANTNLDLERFHADALSTRNNASNIRNRTNSELSALQLLLTSIERGENLVPYTNAEQHRRYLDYSMNIERFESMISQQRAKLESLEESYATQGEVEESELEESEGETKVSESDINEARSELESTIAHRDIFKNDAQISILQSINGLERNVTELNATVLSADSMLGLSDSGFSEELLQERYMLDMLVSISDTLFSLQNNRDTLQLDIGSLRLAIDEARIIAPIDGIVSMFGEMNVGDFIQAGMDIATILPMSDGEHRVILYVSNADIADIEVGQKINFRFAALPFADYGEMPGRVIRISTDARNSEDGQSFFVVEAEMDRGSLHDRSGIEAAIRVGMVCDARVITNTQKIIFWVLERLNFID